MTTTINVITHGWPVVVETNSNHSYADAKRSSFGHSHTAEFVPAASQKSFAVTDTTSVTVRELPKDATGLEFFVHGQVNETALGSVSATPASFLDRLKVEQDELAQRFDKLTAFIGTAGFDALPEGSQADLKTQHDIMGAYVDILAKRLDAITSEPAAG